MFAVPVAVSAQSAGEVWWALWADAGLQSLRAGPCERKKGTISGINAQQRVLGCSKLCESVGVEHDCSGVFGVKGESVGRLYVRHVIERPLLFSIAA